MAGPDARIVEIRIDDGDFMEFDLYHKFGKDLHYQRTVIFSDNMKQGDHKIRLLVLKKSSSKGNAIRILNFAVN